MKVANGILLALNLVAGAAIIWLLSRGPIPPLADEGWSYNDLIAVILTALGVVLSAVTLAVAIVALWSFSTLRRSAGSAAQRTAREQQTEYFKSEDFQLMLRRLISEQKENEEKERARAGVGLEPAVSVEGAGGQDQGDVAWTD